MSPAVSQIHFVLNMQHSGIHPAAWRSPGADPLGFITPAFHRRIAALAEQGLIDSLFFADHMTLWKSPEAGPGWSFDPIVTLAGLAAVTSHVGLVASISTTLSSPYPVARTIQSLDHLSGGRAGWNVVTSWSEPSARNFDIQSLPPREERYDRAEEFVDVVKALWSSWSPGAILAEREQGRFLDPAKVRPIQHRGRHFTVEGPLQVPPGPQGQPIVFQAGGSDQGRDLAARHADAVFTAQTDLAAARAYRQDLRRRAAAFGRAPDAIKVFPGVIIVAGATRAEARAERARLEAFIGGDEALLGRFAQSLNLPAERLRLDEPFPADLIGQAIAGNPRQGFADALAAALGNSSITLRDQLERNSVAGHRSLIGSGDEIADSLEEWVVEGAADGFILMCDLLPAGLEAFVTHVVPRLQARGLYPREYSAPTLRARLFGGSA